MTHNTMVATVAKHPFLSNLRPEYRERVAGCAANERFAAGDYIFCEGQPADKFYLVRHGCVALEIHQSGRQPLVVETVDADDVVGWSWLVPPYQWFLDARAVEMTRLISLDADCLRTKMDHDHEFGFSLYQLFMPVIAKRMQAGRLQLTDSYGLPEHG